MRTSFLTERRNDGRDSGFPSEATPSQCFVIEVARETHRLAHVRAFGFAVLRLWSCSDEVAEDGRTVISELVTNAVVHSPGPSVGVLIVRRGAEIRIEVNDRTPSLIPAPQEPHPQAEGGRGLGVVKALAQRHGGAAGHRADGAIAWCTLLMSDTSENR